MATYEMHHSTTVQCTYKLITFELHHNYTDKHCVVFHLSVQYPWLGHYGERHKYTVFLDIIHRFVFI
jgi:hypothetical protein